MIASTPPHRIAMPLPRQTAAPLAACATLLAFHAATPPASPQTPPTAHISEETRVLDTYPFSDPNPIPILATDRRLYPYHTFEGYSATSEPREWKVVRMENDLIELFVLPEVGGKVWGAVVKETGHEFIYRNEVMKFRDIALRGPWTSGGIEFNFGVIGHTPATATPVDYTLRENDDGSVSIFVGAMDLPSRTHWRVEIRLPPDRAYFETHALWYNPTPLEQPYYNWMTAAAFAQDDLEIFVPGGSYLEHSGRERTWPLDEAGRFLPLYRNNAFGGNKSYHVVGELNDFFGGYYHDDDYGWGHWARYEDMPGQKMWLWSLARDGGIWEDLLTDTDGQYVEFQAGRLFVQYQPGDHRNPVTQAAFDPLSASAWTETWFPLEGTGGLTDASREGAMHVERDGSRVRVVVNAFGNVADTLKVWSGGAPGGEVGEPVAVEPVFLTALQPFEAIFAVSPEQPFRVALPGLNLDYSSDPAERMLDRPFEVDAGAWAAIPEADRLVFEARELDKGRRYPEARALYEAAAALEPWHRDALLGLGGLALRSARYEEGLDHARRALQLDTYDAAANFLAGILYRALGRRADARDAFGWAARAVAFRAAAYVQLAEIMLAAGDPAVQDFDETERYARLAIDFDRHSVPAWQILAIAARLSGDEARAEAARAELLAIDPLHHFVLAERYLDTLRADPASSVSTEAAARLTGAMRSEYPGQTLVELAVSYANRGLAGDALALLELVGEGPATPIAHAWTAFLARDPARLTAPEGEDLAFAFPFRTETLPVLHWAAEQSDHWAWRYLHGLNLWALDRDDEAASTLEALRDQPDYGPAYAARGHLLRTRGDDPGLDFQRALEFDPENRLLRIELIRHLQGQNRWAGALEASARGREIFPDDFNLALLHARALLHLGGNREAIEVLAATHVLPSENARESHLLYELAHAGAALDALEADDNEAARGYLQAGLLWPETLGQGRPYDPDERMVRFLLGVAAERAGDAAAARAAFEAVVGGTTDLAGPPASVGDLLAIAAAHSLGRDPALSIDEAVSQFLTGGADGLPEAGEPSPLAGLAFRTAQRALVLHAPGSP